MEEETARPSVGRPTRPTLTPACLPTDLPIFLPTSASMPDTSNAAFGGLVSLQEKGICGSGCLLI